MSTAWDWGFRACSLILVLLVMVGAEWCRALDEGLLFIASTRTVAFPCSLPGVPQLCFWSIMLELLELSELLELPEQLK